MQKNLKWCVGKFVYPKGGSSPVHYMPLKDFHLQSALDLSLLMSLRAKRTSEGRLVVGDSDIADWLDRTAVEILVDMTMAHLAAVETAKPATIREVCPGVGLTFESLKLRLSQNGAADSMHYVAVGDESGRERFNLLHSDDIVSFDYVPGPVDDGRAESAVTLLNHNQAVREGSSEYLDLDMQLKSISGPIVGAIRAVGGDTDVSATSVRGDVVTLPSVDRLLAMCREDAMPWVCKVVEDFDSNFFLPMEGGRSCLVLVYRGSADLGAKGFDAVV